MSLVGTRPPTVDEWKQYEPYHRGRLAVKPGLTGMWQVSGRSDITDFEEVVKLDMEYVKNWDIGMDIKILFKTVGVVLKGSGSNCKILDNDFHPIEVEARNKLLQDENGGDSDLVPSREIKIGKNCFIGCNSIILKGTVLGDGCVVGAGAVVAGKFENNCVIVGNPAKVIKRLEGNK